MHVPNPVYSSSCPSSNQFLVCIDHCRYKGPNETCRSSRLAITIWPLSDSLTFLCLFVLSASNTLTLRAECSLSAEHFSPTERRRCNRIIDVICFTLQLSCFGSLVKSQYLYTLVNSAGNTIKRINCIILKTHRKSHQCLNSSTKNVVGHIVVPLVITTGNKKRLDKLFLIIIPTDQGIHFSTEKSLNQEVQKFTKPHSLSTYLILALKERVLFYSARYIF